MEENKDQESKKTNTRAILFFAVALIAIALFVILQNKTTSDKYVDIHRTQNGLIAPNFTFPDLDGRMVSLSNYKGKVILVNIWATWCPPCVAEIPSLDKLYKMLKDDGFELLAVSVDEGGKKAVERFMKKNNFSFPVLLDPEGRVTQLYRTTGVPESFIIRKDGVIDERIMGAIDWTSPKVLEYFQKLIQEK